MKRIALAGIVCMVLALTAWAVYQNCSVISGSTDSYFPAMSSSGTLVAYWTGDPEDTDVNSSIVLYNSSNSSRTTISGSLTRVSRPAISRDGQTVTFWGEHTDGNIYPFAYDVGTASLSRCNLYTSRALYNGPTTWPPVASDLRDENLDRAYVAFREDYTAPNNASITRIVVWDLGSTLRDASASEPGDQPQISLNGQIVAFASDSVNLLSNSGNKFQVFVSLWNRATTAWVVSEIASKSSAGTIGNSDSDQPSMSSDGSRIAFASTATNLTSPSGTSGFASLYLRDRGTSSTTLRYDNNSSLSGFFGVGALMPSISPDGGWIAFMTCASITGASSNSHTGPFVALLDLSGTTTEAVSYQYNGGSSPYLLLNASLASLANNAAAIAFSATDTGICASDNTGYARVYRKDTR